MSSMTVQSLNTATTALLIRPEPLATRAAHWPLLGGPSRPWPPADSSSSSRVSQNETPLVHTYISCMSVQTLSMHILPLIFSYVGQVIRTSKFPVHSCEEAPGGLSRTWVQLRLLGREVHQALHPLPKRHLWMQAAPNGTEVPWMETHLS